MKTHRWHDLSRAAVPLALALLLGACTANGGSPAASSSPPGATGDPADCTATATSGDDVARRAGGCGGRLDDLRHRRRAAATPTSPWGRRGRRTGPSRSLGEGSTPVRAVTVSADHVVVQGFVVVGGEGIELRGAISWCATTRCERADQDGISCEDLCEDAVIEDNTVVGSDGAGIIVRANGSLVRGNSVSGSVRREAGDADGIRFFGTDMQILENTVFDIKDDGYGGDHRTPTASRPTTTAGCPPWTPSSPTTYAATSTTSA